MQITGLHAEVDSLQLKYGAKGLPAVYGAGCVRNPEVMLMFMNPTGKNISADSKWKGLRAPWIGTKSIWPMLRNIGFLPEKTFQLTQQEWNEGIAHMVYKELARQKVYITNLAKCTQVDARHLSDFVFKAYLPATKKEIALVNPKRILTFGNQVSSTLLERPVSVSEYTGVKKELYVIGDNLFNVYPVYYPIGQGRRNQPLAVRRIRAILK